VKAQLNRCEPRYNPVLGWSDAIAPFGARPERPKSDCDAEKTQKIRPNQGFCRGKNVLPIASTQ
jgi:hypothetical protein